MGVPVALGVLFCLIRKLNEKPTYDPRLVQEKISHPALLAQLRIAVIAPAQVPRRDVQAQLDRIAAAYHQFGCPAGNTFRQRRMKAEGCDLREPRPLIERTSARQHLPLPVTVERGCPIGVSTQHGRSVPVSLPDPVLHRHLLMVAKTRRGKSSLLLHIARYLMEGRGPDGCRSGLVLIDPHQDLARAALTVVPRDRWKDVVYLDLANRDRPFGLNLLDVGLFPDRDKAVSNALLIFKREFDRYWGPRMEDAFRYALLALYDANCRQISSQGADSQYTVLDVAAMFEDLQLRKSVLALVEDPGTRKWWAGYFETLERRLRIEISNPVQTKIHRFAGSRAARLVVGQPHSTIQPETWVRNGKIVIVNTAKGTVGDDTAALVGATLLNLVALQVGEQANLAPDRRKAVSDPAVAAGARRTLSREIWPGRRGGRETTAGLRRRGWRRGCPSGRR